MGTRVNLFKSIFSEHTIITWMMVVAIFPMLLLVYFAYDFAQTTLQHTISNVLLAEIKKKVVEIDSYISERKLNLVQFSELPELVSLIKASDKKRSVSQLDTTKISSFANYLHYIAPKIGVANIYIMGMDSNILFALHDDGLSGGALSKNKFVYQELLQAFEGARVLRMPTLYTFFNAGSEFGATIYLSSVIRDKGITKAVLIMKLDPSAIEKIIKLNFGYAKSAQSSLAMLVENKPAVVIKTNKQKAIISNISEIVAMNDLLMHI